MDTSRLRCEDLVASLHTIFLERLTHRVCADLCRSTAGSLLGRNRCAMGRRAVEQVSRYCRCRSGVEIDVGNDSQEGRRAGVDILQNWLIKQGLTQEWGWRDKSGKSTICSTLQCHP